MRLLYLTRGCNIHDRRFLQAFASHGWTIGFASLTRPDIGDPYNVIPDGARHLVWLGLRPKPSTDELRVAAANLRPAVVNFQPEIVLAGPVHDGGFVAAQAALPCPWVVQSWAFDVLWEIERDADALARARIVLQACPGLLADSRAVIQKCESIAGRSLEKQFLLPWGIDLANTKPAKARSAVRAELGIGPQTVFLCTRGLEAKYRIDVLLDAFRKFQASDRNAVLLLASEGSLRSGLETQVKADGLANSVKFLGAVDHHHLLDLFAASDFFVSTAESDGTSIALLEAMYLGVIPIVSNVGGNPEWIRHGINGWLAESGDADDFARALNLGRQMTESRRLGAIQSNRNLVQSRADWTLNFSRWLSELTQLAHPPTSDK